jgi:alanyl-tRNA synthetase
VEDLANRVIAENRPVRARWVEPEELTGLDLRKMPPAGKKKIRLIDIEQFDLDPCGGTHVRHTSEVQLVKILRWEKLRGDLRFYFLAGGRAVRHYSQLWELTRQLTQELTAGEKELLGRIRDLKSNLKIQKKALRDLKTFWTDHQAALLQQKAKDQGQSYLIEWFEDTDFADLKALAQKLVTGTNYTVALFAVSQSGWRLVLARPESGNTNLREWLEDIRAVYPAKGGGRPLWVEAVGKGHPEEIIRLLKIKMTTER